MARHAMNTAIHHSGQMRYGAFPYGILAVNTAGCLAIGLLAGLLAAGRVQMGEHVRTFLVVGVLGGFTTFSSFGLDTFTLMRGGQSLLALTNIGAHVALGLTALWAGFTLGSWRF